MCNTLNVDMYNHFKCFKIYDNNAYAWQQCLDSVLGQKVALGLCDIDNILIFFSLLLTFSILAYLY